MALLKASTKGVLLGCVVAGIGVAFLCLEDQGIARGLIIPWVGVGALATGSLAIIVGSVGLTKALTPRRALLVGLIMCSVYIVPGAIGFLISGIWVPPLNPHGWTGSLLLPMLAALASGSLLILVGGLRFLVQIRRSRRQITTLGLPRNP